MKRMKAVIAYDGSGFAGYQIQPEARTIQRELMKVLKNIHKGRDVQVVASGRTDAKVHATGQVIHFDTDFNIPVEGWLKALNVLLPEDIRVSSIEEAAPEFHARYHTIGKTYRYKWDRSTIISPFTRNYMVHLKQRPDVDAMRKAAKAILGTHDFSSFCAANTGVVDKVRTIRRLDFEEHGEELHMVIEGSGFLYNMVRIIAGTLFEVGIGKRNPEEVAEIIRSADRAAAGKTAAAHGLYLENVEYES
ncbi:tRNA pseudouridine(38-40) synthase TruA [Planococcus halotolerans]|uniref:tRNA pseudouridine synthase A n=1 Tax=Planococcus halotolerans TaxID=2233542 RepID=A0A365KKD0_9BACL|nr:tRNA pseudouridine(38-40) synthase TruA [Planococcus halotolerans]QHJ69622.1 tRNA pseudouridine(38-40) synthase TruA [Planococcus halotolerans]RAZ73593.1 tRNA pseudouridine(38-40) synthase TruA [Planococcus halotolerans]